MSAPDDIPPGENLPTGYDIVVGVMTGFGGDPIKAAELLHLSWSVSFRAVEQGESERSARRLRLTCLYVLANVVLPQLQARAREALDPTSKKTYGDTARTAAETVEAWRNCDEMKAYLAASPPVSVSSEVDTISAEMN